MITKVERKLIGISENDPLPSGGREYKVYSFSGFKADSTTSWTNSFVSLKNTLREAFGMSFFPGSLNVRLMEGVPWYPPNDLNKKPIRLGVFEEAYALPVILEEKCVGIVAAINVRGFDPATSERILPPMMLDKCEMYQIYSPVCIRERLDHWTDDDIINVRLLSGDLL